jgi:glycosyltransferase involved in cell wall biosynthesis
MGIRSSSTVAVIMPTYNGESYLQDQIESILNQTFTDFTLHLIDDQSTDKTWDIINELTQIDGRIRLHKNSSQQGVIGNVDSALSTIDADIYFLADQDDIWLLDKMEKQMLVLDQADVIMTFSNLDLVCSTGEPISTDFWSSQEIDPDEVECLDILAIKTMVTGCTMAFKKELLDIALPIPKEATMHDHWLSFFAAASGRVIPVKETLVFYRQHSNNVIGAQISSFERRKSRYDGCSSYQDYKSRKYQSYREMSSSIRAFDERLRDHNIDHPFLKKYVAFYDSLLNHQWLKALLLSIGLKNLPKSNGFLRTLLISIFFPIFYIFLRINQRVRNR